jgi:hypothetical protein
LEPVCAWLAFGVPFAVTLTRTASSTQWRDDLAVVRGLGLLPLGSEGALSSVALQLSSLLPLGGRSLRASLASALALSVGSFFAYCLTRRALGHYADRPAIAPLLSLCAALSATLSAGWQLEGTVAGGAALAAAVALGGLFLRERAAHDDARAWLCLGVVTGAAVVESHVAALVLGAALAAHVLLVGELPARRSLAWCASGALGAVALGLSPLLLRWHGSARALDPSVAFWSINAGAAGTSAKTRAALDAWLLDVGPVSLGLASAGLIWGLARRKTRRIAGPLAVFCVSALVFPARSGGTLVPDTRAVLHLLSVVALTSAGALALNTALLALERAQIRFVGPTLGAVIAFQFTQVLMTAEDSSFLADRRAQHAADVWTDEALRSLPPNSALLVRSPPLMLRLWAARVVRGERADVLIVPLPFLERDFAQRRLLEVEPALGPLIRDIAINGRPSEFALSTLADARSLHVELDPAWDPRLFDHLVPSSLWLRFAPHALGRSDRRAGLPSSHESLGRVLSFADGFEHRDEATLGVLAQSAAEQALLLASLGDRSLARRTLDHLKTISPEHVLVAPIEQHLNAQAHARLDLTALLGR